jgi:NAD(P)-dependent dehydrogenase (short-subunit alcohol dehydrogenase family)
MAVTWTYADIPDQTGRTAIVTGATSGLGLVIARRLAAAGADVIAAVRDPEKAARVLPGVEARRLDLADLDSVHDFAARLRADGRPVDLLINNAGINHAGTVRVTRQLSPQGVESTFATNFLGHFVLTGRLLDAFRTDGRARVVHVSSALYRYYRGPLPVDDLAAERSYSPGKAYVASKLANLAFGVELDRRLRAHGVPVASVSAHPGMADTPMNAHVEHPAQRAVVEVVRALSSRPPERAAIPLLYAATGPAPPPGVLVGPGIRRTDDRVHVRPVRPPAADPALGARLWQVAEARGGVEYLR